MNNCPTPEALAIFVGEGRAPGVTNSHIAECASCSEFVQELKADQALLQLQPEISETVCTDLRRGVLSQVTRTRARHLPWLAAAIAAAFMVTIFLPFSKSPLPPPLVISSLAPPIGEPPVLRAGVGRQLVKSAGVRAARKPKPSSAALIAALDSLDGDPAASAPGAPGQVVITMATEDPNVTIILLGETKGDEE